MKCIHLDPFNNAQIKNNWITIKFKQISAKKPKKWVRAGATSAAGATTRTRCPAVSSAGAVAMATTTTSLPNANVTCAVRTAVALEVSAPTLLIRHVTQLLLLLLLLLLPLYSLEIKNLLFNPIIIDLICNLMSII